MKSNDKVWRVLSAVALLLIALALSACSMGGGAEATGDSVIERFSTAATA